MLVGVVACSGGTTATSDAPTSTTLPTLTTSVESVASPAFDALILAVASGTWRANAEERIEVWVCHVPHDATAGVYGGLPLRLPLTPTDLAAVLATGVTTYFETVSHGKYSPRFVAGDEVHMAAGDEPQACIDEAIAGAAAETGAVLVVADAEHAAGQPGGFSSGGHQCPADPPCGADQSRRFVYVGASDFHPDWGADPPLDLVEHELGHALGWVHSGYDATGATPYLSALDVMSNSAAPREIDPERRDAPDTLAVQRLIAGWLTAVDVLVAPPEGGSATLQSSTGSVGLRLLVLPVDARSFLAVELLTADGFDAHLPADGVAVHLVTLDGSTVLPMEPLVGNPPFTDLLQQGESLVTHGWSITVADGWRVSAEPTTA